MLSGPEAMDHVGQDRERGAPAEWSHQRERQEIGWKMQRREDG